MKKSLIWLAVLVVAASAAASAETVFLGGSGEPSAAARVVTDTATETVLTFSMDGFVREKETEGGVTYDRVILRERGTTENIGLPELPALNETVMIPGDRKVSVDIVKWDEVTLSGYNVWPFQTPATDFDFELPFVRDNKYYAAGSTYPTAKVELGTPAIFRDIRVIPLRVYPFRWNPATGELRVARKITVKLKYYGQDTVNTLRVTGYRDPDFEPLYENTVVNYKEIGRAHV